jgi:hypothetical protein
VQFVVPPSRTLRALLAIALVLLNIPENSYGHLEHTSHLFLLAHLYGVFLPLRGPTTEAEAEEQAVTVRWYYIGLLSIYTMAALWKLAYIARSMVLHNGEPTWLFGNGFLINSVASFRALDMPLTVPRLFAVVPWIGIIGFFAVIAVQLFAIVAAWRPAFKFPFALGVIFFHLSTGLAQWTWFVFAMVVLFTIFFPYHIFIRSPSPVTVPVPAGSA